MKYLQRNRQIALNLSEQHAKVEKFIHNKNKQNLNFSALSKAFLVVWGAAPVRASSGARLVGGWAPGEMGSVVKCGAPVRGSATRKDVAQTPQT